MFPSFCHDRGKPRVATQRVQLLVGLHVHVLMGEDKTVFDGVAQDPKRFVWFVFLRQHARKHIKAVESVGMGWTENPALQFSSFPEERGRLRVPAFTMQL